MNDSKIPAARKSGLVIQDVDEEVLVYDLDNNKAHCLNRTAAFVWKACDGRKTAADIATQMEKEFAQKVSEDLVWLAVDQLSRGKLLEGAAKPEILSFSRRETLKKIGLAAAVALPVVAMLSFPISALASTCEASLCGPMGSCSPGDVCCFGTCEPGACTMMTC